LAINPILQELILCGNRLKTLGAITITNALWNMSSLLVLNLRDNSIGDEAADCIADILSHNTELQQLDLSGNNLRKEGAIRIASALMNTTKLTIFNMANNNIDDDDAAETITAMLMLYNTKLQQFDISGSNAWLEESATISTALEDDYVIL